MADGQPGRDKLLTRWSALKAERSSWMTHWREISDYLMPRSGRFISSDRNRGDKRHNAIYDSTGPDALRVLGAGMMAGANSPARPWFRLTTSDPSLDESARVKQWLADVQRLMLMVFAKSNTYPALHALHEENGAFGTAATLVLPDFDKVIHHYPLTCGEYAIATDHRGYVNTLYREFDKTVAELVGEFGRDKVSQSVRNLYDRGNLDAWVTIIHAIEPRRSDERDLRKRDAKNMAFRSVYFEPSEPPGKYLRESGFRNFPGLAPRWAATGGDIYGNSPGMMALGDIKQLQHQQLRKAQAIDYQTKPPLQLPTQLKNMEADFLPGGATYVDLSGPQSGIRPAFEVNLRLDFLLADIQDVRERINRAFHADLFLMLANSPRTNMTATEVAERHEEKLLMLGPVLERQQNEMHGPLIDLTFERMLAAGIVPPPPEELQGIELNVEFVSMLAQAQRAVATNSVDRFVMNLGVVAQYKPDVLDKFNSDYWADAYADMTGVDPEMVVPGEQVALIRKQRAEAAQAQAQAEMAQQQADTVKSLAAAKTNEPNALTNVIEMFSGYNT